MDMTQVKPFCASCGTKNEDDKKFCGNCGENLEVANEVNYPNFNND